MREPQALSHTAEIVPIDTERQLRQSVHVQLLAECLYETAGLLDRLAENAPTWDHLTGSEKARYRFAAIAALNGLSPSKRYEAELRAREHVAHLPHYGRAFHLLPGRVQRQIAAEVQTGVNTYLRVIEGLFQPLRGKDANLLEPAAEESVS